MISSYVFTLGYIKNLEKTRGNGKYIYSGYRRITRGRVICAEERNKVGFYVGLNNAMKIFITGRLLPLNLTISKEDQSQIKGINL